MLHAGDVLAGKYRIVRMIGKGGMGAVYEAQHEIIGKRLAVKVLWPNFTDNEEAVRRFTQEARAASAVGHPAIIDVHDLGRDADENLFLVMEFLDGQALGTLLNEQPVLDVPYAAYVVCQILSALDAAHSKGIVHRDLKPDNIFLVDTGQALPAVKLLDFGISKIVDAQTPDLGVTRTGTTLGTPFYMSPEQAEGARDIDSRTDIWSTGVILYEALTGAKPFVAETVPAVMQEVIASRPARPLDLRPDLPEALDWVILRALSKRREDRYPTAGAMLAALLPFVDERDRGQLALRKIAAVAEADAAPIAGDAPADLADDTERDKEPVQATPTEHVAPAVSTNMAWQSRLSQSQIARSRRGPIVAAALGVAVLLGAVAVVAWLATSGGEGQGRPATVAAESREAGPATRPSGDSAPHVTLTLDGVPTGARVFLDEMRQDGLELRRARSGDEHAVRVEADGFEPWSRVVRFESDATIVVTLVPASIPVSGEPPDPRPAVAAEPIETATRPPAKTRSPQTDRERPPVTTKNERRDLEPDRTNPYGAQ